MVKKHPLNIEDIMWRWQFIRVKSNEKKLEDKLVLNRLNLPNLSNRVSGIGKLKPNILFIQMH